MTALASGGEITEYFLTCLHLLINVGMALKDLAVSHKFIASLGAAGVRLGELWESTNRRKSTQTAPLRPSHTAAAAAAAVPRRQSAAMGAGATLLAITHLNIMAPDATVLVHDLSICVKRGEPLLIQGPNGSGKSGILRVLAGIWPCVAAGGARVEAGDTVVLPPQSDCFFLPQRAYVARNLTFRQQLLYPRPGGRRAGGAKGGGKGEAGEEGVCGDEELLSVLKLVGLGGGKIGVSSVEDLGRQSYERCRELSGGELQRLAIARLLSQRPRPSLVFLDEATSATTVAFEDWLYVRREKRREEKRRRWRKETCD